MVKFHSGRQGGGHLKQARQARAGREMTEGGIRSRGARLKETGDQAHVLTSETLAGRWTMDGNGDNDDGDEATTNDDGGGLGYCSPAECDETGRGFKFQERQRGSEIGPGADELVSGGRKRGGSRLGGGWQLDRRG